jgi:hypothetical protein
MLMTCRILARSATRGAGFGSMAGPRSVFWSVALAAIGLGPACKTAGEVTVRDSEGRSFLLRCARERGDCSLNQQAGPRAPGTTPTLRSEGRLFGVCDRSGEEAAHPADCRPLRCDADADCPAASGAASGTCIDAHCVDPTHEVVAADSVMLCLAGTGLGHSLPAQVERYALGLNCGTPCRIPAPCAKR